MTCIDDQKIPPTRKQSKAKIWIKTGIFIIFSIIFSLTLYKDMMQGSFRLLWALMAFVPCLGLGFWMSRLVPMQKHPKWQVVTISFDRIYFILIFVLVIIKAITGNILGLTIISDVIICVILGLMVSRISGICLRVHGLKKDMAFLQNSTPSV